MCSEVPWMGGKTTMKEMVRSREEKGKGERKNSAEWSEQRVLDSGGMNVAEFGGAKNDGRLGKRGFRETEGRNGRRILVQRGAAGVPMAD
ncbi:unnamed protein product [Calypogeia fissa]